MDVLVSLEFGVLEENSNHAIISISTPTTIYVRILTGVIKCLWDRADQICHSSRKKQELEYLELSVVCQWLSKLHSGASETTSHTHAIQQLKMTDRRHMLYLPNVLNVSERMG